MAGVAVVGLLFLRCVALTSPIGPAHRHLMVMATRWAWVWVASTVVWIVLTMSDLSGLPVNELLQHTDVVVIVVGTDRVLVELATLWVALALALFVGRLTSTKGVAIALLAATVALLPSAVTGHAGHHTSPWLAAITLGVHVAAAALWVGGLLALIVHLRAFPDQLQRAVPRFSAVALGCVIAVGVSGVLESVVMLGSWYALWDTNRGHLMAAKAVALVLLVLIGYWHRQRTVPAAVSGRLMPLLRLGVGELLLMSATIGIAVVLSTTA
jgi:putative copper resistance protein D